MLILVVAFLGEGLAYGKFCLGEDVLEKPLAKAGDQNVSTGRAGIYTYDQRSCRKRHRYLYTLQYLREEMSEPGADC
jgi:hypothetical protein